MLSCAEGDHEMVDLLLSSSADLNLKQPVSINRKGCVGTVNCYCMSTVCQCHNTTTF